MMMFVLATLAVMLFAVAAFLQQRGAREVVATDPSTASLRGLHKLMRSLVRSRTWLLGWFSNFCGFLCHASALHLGSVATVQPLISGQLLFALPLSSIDHRRRPRARDWAAALAVCGGLALFFGVGGVSPLRGHADRGRVLLAVAAAVLVVSTLAVISSRLPAAAGAPVAAVAAGVCFSMSATFMKLTVDDLVGPGIGATATDWPGYALAVSTITGLMLEQTSFAGGPLPWAVAGHSVTNPIVSYAIGVLGFHTAFPSTPLQLTALALAGALLTSGIIGLAHSETVKTFYAEPKNLETEDALPTAAAHPDDHGSGVHA